MAGRCGADAVSKADTVEECGRFVAPRRASALGEARGAPIPVYTAMWDENLGDYQWIAGRTADDLRDSGMSKQRFWTAETRILPLVFPPQGQHDVADDIRSIARLYDGEVDFEKKVLAHLGSLYNLDATGAAYLFLNTYHNDDRLFSSSSSSTSSQGLPVPEATKVPILSVYNFKGGVGKTTTTLGLAGAWAAQGKRVGVIDGDPQGNTTQIFLNWEVGEEAGDDDDDDGDGAAAARPAAAAAHRPEPEHGRYEGFYARVQDRGGLLQPYEAAERPPERQPPLRDTTLGQLHKLSTVFADFNGGAGFEYPDPAAVQRLLQMNKAVYDPDLLGRCGGEICYLAADADLMEQIERVEARLGWEFARRCAGGACFASSATSWPRGTTWM